MDSDILHVLAPVGLFFAVAAVVAAIRHRYVTPTGRIRRAMRAVPRTAVASAEEGTDVRLVGRVVTRGEPLRAPISGSRCAVYDVLVRFRGSRAAVSFDGGHVLHDSEVKDFYLDDGTGKVLVRTEGAELLLSPQVHELGGGAGGVPREVLRYLERKRISPKGPLGLGRRLRCSEGTLVEGEQVAVVGVVRNEPHPRDEDRELLVIEGRGAGPALVSDHPSVLR